jgi:ABC-type sugar transport system ATPase subunit
MTGLAGATVLRLSGLAKAFPGVQALREASLDVRSGEVHALVGENGAGKSTLLKIVTGAHAADRGLIELDGAARRFAGPRDARRRGVAAIYQELSLVPALSARANLFLGVEPRRGPWLDEATERREAAAALDRVGAACAPDTPVRNLSVAAQQLVEIARALRSEVRLLILDEPTAALTPRESERLLALLGELRARGLAILFVSHRLDEVLRIADRVTVMRDGATLGTWAVGELTRQTLIERMVGRPLGREYPKVAAAPGAPRLEVRDLRGGAVRGVSFTVRAGEVLGIAGLAGAGRTETARLIFGADRRVGGTILVDGEPVDVRSPRDAVRHGICLLTEDRKGQGLVPGLSASDNFALPNLARWSRHGWIDGARETAAFLRHVEALNIRIASPRQRAGELSGGNQQKLLVARWLESDSRVLIFDEPTRGIDVGARHEMYLLINALAARGKAIVMISSDLPEVLGMSDRLVVMHAGRISGEIADAAGATQARVMELAVGGSAAGQGEEHVH